jgi:hypothetical protein
MSAGRIDQLAYGKNKIGVSLPTREGHGQFQRVDTYTNDRTGETENYRVFSADKADDSPVFSDYGHRGRYGSECASCYLNFPHSEKLHNRRVAEAENRLAIAA